MLLLELLRKIFSKVTSLCIIIILGNLIIFHKSTEILFMIVFYLTILLFLFDVLIPYLKMKK